MSYVEYEKAQKLGLKAFKNAVSKGENEYLPVLDEILEGVDIVGEMSLGIVQIPLDRIVGTSNVGRTYAFANNFMPLLDYKTDRVDSATRLRDMYKEQLDLYAEALERIFPLPVKEKYLYSFRLNQAIEV